MAFSCLSAATSAGMVPCRMLAVRICLVSSNRTDLCQKLKDHVRNPLTRHLSVACHPVACSYCAPLEGAAPHAHAHAPSPPPPPQNRR